jgi:hypothetical protein
MKNISWYKANVEANVIFLEASESISKYDLISVDSNGGAIKANGNESTFIGIALVDGIIGEDIAIQTRGLVFNPLWSLTTSDKVYISETSEVSGVSSGYSVGFSISTNKIFIVSLKEERLSKEENVNTNSVDYNSVTKVYTLQNTYDDITSFKVYLGGIRLMVGASNDYVVIGNTIVFNEHIEPADYNNLIIEYV